MITIEFFRNRGAGLMALFLLFICWACNAAPESPPVPLVDYEELNDGQQKFDGKIIRIQGFLVKKDAFKLSLYPLKNFADNFVNPRRKLLPGVTIIDDRLSHWFDERSIHVELTGRFRAERHEATSFGFLEIVHSIRFLSDDTTDLNEE